MGEIIKILQQIKQQAEISGEPPDSFYNAIDYLIRSGQDYVVKKLFDDDSLSENAKDKISDALFKSGYRYYFRTETGDAVAIPFAIILTFSLFSPSVTVPSHIAGLVSELSNKQVLREMFQLDKNVDVMVDSNLYMLDDPAWGSPSKVRNYLSAAVKYIHGQSRYIPLASTGSTNVNPVGKELSVFRPRALVGVAILNNMSLYDKVEELLFERKIDSTKLEAMITNHINKKTPIVKSLSVTNFAMEFIDVPDMACYLITSGEIEQRFSATLAKLLLTTQPGIFFEPKIYIQLYKTDVGTVNLIEIRAYAKDMDDKPFFSYIHKVDYNSIPPEFVINAIETIAEENGAEVFVITNNKQPL